MILAATAFATLLPVACYVFIGLRRRSWPTSLDDYFIYGRKVNANDFANTTVGYSLQMAALFLFADWGIRYGFGAFWVPVFWGLGFGLLYLAIPRLGQFLSQNWTIHGYLHNAFSSRAVQVMASLATIIGLWGTMMAEIDYATSVYQPFFTDPKSLYVLGMVFLLFGFIYITYGGYKAEVNTERIQVPIAYATLLLVVLIMIQNVYAKGFASRFWMLNGLLLLCFLIMIKAKADTVPGHRFADRQIFIPIVGIGLQLLLIIVSLSSGWSPSTGPGLEVYNAGSFGTQLRAQGTLGLVSLFFANALWQFADVSSWQRISSVKLTTGTHQFAQIQRGIRRVMLESPVSWIFGAILGMTLNYSGFLHKSEDPSVALTNFAAAIVTGKTQLALLGGFTWFIFPVLVAAVIAIMLSTVDALISAISFTSYHDLPPYGKSKSLNSARMWTFLITLLGGVLYYGLRFISHIDIQTALYAFYSSQLSLFAPILGTLLTKRLCKTAAFSAIAAGIATAFVTAFFVANKPQYAVTPPLFALLVSSTMYILVSTWCLLFNKSGSTT
jgi:Na+/proline symporter